MLKKFIGIAISLTMAASVLTGCGDKKVDYSENAEKPEPVHAEYSDGSFNFDDAMKNTKIAGKTISLPCALKELGDEFEVDNETPIDGYDYSVFDLSLNGTEFGKIALENGEEKTKKRIINNMIFDHNIKGNVSVFGLDTNSSMEDFVEYMGEPSIKTDVFMEYSDEKGAIAIYFDDTFFKPIIFVFSLIPENNSTEGQEVQ